MKTWVLFLLLFSLLSGCAYIEYNGQWPPSDSGSSYSKYQIPPTELIKLEPNKEVYKVGEEIKGIFTNHYEDTLYVLYPHGGGDSPLQKWNETKLKWETINTKREGVSYIQVVRYRSIPYGKSRILIFPVDRLIEKNIEVEGSYRFLFTLKYSNVSGGKNLRVVSRPFMVEH
jgi:hypothetical protein